MSSETLKKIQSGSGRVFGTANHQHVQQQQNMMSTLSRSTLSPIRKKQPSGSFNNERIARKELSVQSPIKKLPPIPQKSTNIEKPLFDEKEIQRKQIYATNHMMKIIETQKWELLKRGSHNSRASYTL